MRKNILRLVSCITIALIILIVMVSGLTACHPDVGGNPTGNQDARYNASIVISSYSDMLNAWNLLTENAGEGKYDCNYSFNEKVGNYETLYYFTKAGAWQVPTTDIEVYFSNVKNPSFASYLFDRSAEPCGCGRHDFFVEVPGEYIDIQKYPYIQLVKSENLNSGVIELDDLSLLTLSGKYKGEFNSFVYVYSYGDECVFRFESCRDLSAGELAELITHVVTLK